MGRPLTAPIRSPTRSPAEAAGLPGWMSTTTTPCDPAPLSGSWTWRPSQPRRGEGLPSVAWARTSGETLATTHSSRATINFEGQPAFAIIRRILEISIVTSQHRNEAAPSFVTPR